MEVRAHNHYWIFKGIWNAKKIKNYHFGRFFDTGNVQELLLCLKKKVKVHKVCIVKIPTFSQVCIEGKKKRPGRQSI